MLGRRGIFAACYFGKCGDGHRGLKALIGLVSLFKNDKEASTNAKFKTLLFTVGLIALFVLSSFLISGGLEPKLFAVGL